VRLDAALAVEPGRAGEVAAELEAAGYDGLWTAETQHDPFLPLAVAATTTRRMLLGTAIATAFTRSPMVTATAAWDLQRASGGRFVLGLGTQVKAHNVRRFGVPFESPGPKLKEQVQALKHIWGAFQGEHPLSFRGRFYRHDYMTPFFDPGPIDHPQIPVYLAAVTPYMYRVVGEIADGVHVHPFHTVQYLREVALPALQEGLQRSGRTRAEVSVVGAGVFVCAEPGQEETVRMQIAFYGSTRTYRPVFDAHGWGDLTDRLRGAVARGEWSEAAGLIGGDVLEAFAISASSWEDAARALGARYDGILDRVSIYGLEAGDAVRVAGRVSGSIAVTRSRRNIEISS
jgi:probable F420-dependent oxidoreductase